MPEERVLAIVQLQGFPLLSDWNVLSAISLYGRATGHFERLQVTVNLEHEPGAVPPLLEGEVQPSFGASGEPVLWSLSFGQQSVAGLECGGRLWVEVRAIQGSGVGDPDSVISGSHKIFCKDSPKATGRFDDEEPPPPNWPGWLGPPEVACPGFGRAFVVALLTGLVLLVIAAATLSLASWVGGLASLGMAGALLATWAWWLPCAPGRCLVLSAILWALKWSTIFGAAIAVLNKSIPALVLVLGYGAAAGMIVVLLRSLRCSVPSARTTLHQLPLS